jgi:hypothetical protein
MLMLIFVPLYLLFALAALCRLVFWLIGMRRDVACRWTDILGCAVCALTGPAIALPIIVGLGQF